MFYLLRHAISVLLLPVTVTIFVPIWISRRYGIDARWPVTRMEVLYLVAGVLLLAVGFSLFAAALAHFFTEGQGTLAPWDPPRKLVVRGPYRYVRNPMISGVLFVVSGEALMLHSIPHAWWAVIFAGMNAVVIPLTEEPILRLKFGDDYCVYCRNVRRFIPRLKPWEGGRR